MDRITSKRIPSVIRYKVNADTPDGPLQGLIPIATVTDVMTKRLGSARRADVFGLMSRQRGFTLIELLVVLGVFVALISMTVPSYLATRPYRLLSGETNRLAGSIRQGRLFALRDNVKVYMEFLPEIDTYRLWTAQGWRAYADVIDPPVRNPARGDYDGDLDGDGDFWWGNSGTPDSPGGVPEDPDVHQDPVTGEWYYEDTDGTYADPDVLLMTAYPGNQPIRTLSPKLRIELDNNMDIANIMRDQGDTRSVAGDNIVPLEVDIRMRALRWGITSLPLGKRNGVLSHFPLYFLVFFPDGTVQASWDAADSTGIDDEILDLDPGRLGAIQIHLQVRGKDYNLESYELFDPSTVFEGDEEPSEPVSPYDTLSLDDSMSDAFGRIITVNNLSGRLIIRNFRPYDLDKFHDPALYDPTVEYY